MTAISQDEAVRYKLALEELRLISGGVSISEVWEIANKALSPPEEMEEVEVVKWCAQDRMGTVSTWNDEKSCRDLNPNCEIFKRTDTHFRPKPKKVLRREWIDRYAPCNSNGGKRWYNKPHPRAIPDDAQLFAEWYTEE